MYPNLFLILLICYYLPFNHAIEPTICLPGVCFKGSWMEEFVSFQGIRYAESPVNELRFKPPIPFSYSEGVYDTSQESTVRCPQWHRMSDGNRTLWGQEDCLLLNIYVPDDVFYNPEDNLELPVMVWIHGGGLINGANIYTEYGPKHFMKRNVIVVTINYRLGPLGFLSMGNDVVPGNQGMRDQVMALNWVNNNIEYFGGDKNRITIFGESAGSLSVAFQLISPMSQGLFQRAILQSGTALNPSWGLITPEHAVQFANQAYELLGCDQEQDILSCMQSKQISTIFESLTSLTDIAATVWGPVPDSGFTSEPFLPGDPEILMASGDFHKDIEMIIGTNADEGLLNLISAILEPSLWEDYRKNIDIIGPMSFFNIPDPKEITTKDVENVHRIIEQYVGSISNINEDHIQGITDMYTDASFLYGTFKTLWYARMWEVKVYQYVLTYQGQFSYTQLAGIEETLGVCHADDLIYLWDPVFMLENGLPLQGNDLAVRDIMVEAWANFATYGNPTPEGISELPPWSPVNSNFQLWNISSPSPSMEFPLDLWVRMPIWDDIVGP